MIFVFGNVNRDVKMDAVIQLAETAGSIADAHADRLCGWHQLESHPCKAKQRMMLYHPAGRTPPNAECVHLPCPTVKADDGVIQVGIVAENITCVKIQIIWRHIVDSSIQPGIA